MSPPTLLTVNQVAQELQVTPLTVSRWIKAKKLKARKVGKGWRITQEDLQEFVSGAFEGFLDAIQANPLLGAASAGDIVEQFRSLMVLREKISVLQAKISDANLPAKERLSAIAETEKAASSVKNFGHSLALMSLEIIEGMNELAMSLEKEERMLLQKQEGSSLISARGKKGGGK